MKTISVPAGNYIIAVSGGVDSMVLLDMLYNSIGPDHLLVAHFRHHVRNKPETARDEQVIIKYCQQRGIITTFGDYSGHSWSESELRNARYRFLNSLLDKNYNKIITAHHRDDLIESAIINLLRGTKGRGMVAMAQNEAVLRPLIGTTKTEILNYAKEHNITWHEDSTNSDLSYLRNYVRANVIPKMKDAGIYEEFTALVDDQKPLQIEIAGLIDELRSNVIIAERIDRRKFIMLPHSVAKAILHSWMKHEVPNLDDNLVTKLVVFVKAARQNASFDVSKQSRLVVDGQDIVLKSKH